MIRGIFVIGTTIMIAAGVTIFGQATSQPESDLIKDLVIANRVLASNYMDVLGIYGHISARSRRSNDRFYLSRNVAPALVTAADIREHDLEGNRIGADRSDQDEERFIDAAIYKARPDVMAVVHTHAPELIAFSVSSIPLPGRRGAPVYDVRKFNSGRLTEITTAQLGQTLAETLGGSPSILLLGHGAVIVAPSVPDAVSAANGLRRNAQLQMQMLAMRGTINPNPRGVPQGQAQTPAAPAARPTGQRPTELDVVNNAVDRAWDHWRRVGAQMLQTRVTADVRRPSAPIDALKQDLVIASRILSLPEIGVLDTAGHVSVRHPTQPNRYLITRAVAPGSATVEAIIENDLDSKPVAGPRKDEFLEVHIHGQIYKARPDVMSVIHAHTPELVAFGQTSVKLRPVSLDGAFIGDGLPLWVVGKYDPTQTLVATPALGLSLATLMGRKQAVLLTGHGVALGDSSLYGLVKRVYDLRVNALIQQQAILLGGDITYLEGQAADVSAEATNGSGNRPAATRFWEYWRRQIAL